jgi:hypothetical protein
MDVFDKFEENQISGLNYIKGGNNEDSTAENEANGPVQVGFIVYMD